MFSNLTLEINFQFRKKKKGRGLVSINGVALSQSCVSSNIADQKVLRSDLSRHYDFSVK